MPPCSVLGSTTLLPAPAMELWGSPGDETTPPAGRGKGREKQEGTGTPWGTSHCSIPSSSQELLGHGCTSKMQDSLCEAQAHQPLLHGGFGRRSHGSEPPSSLELSVLAGLPHPRQLHHSRGSSQPLRGWFVCNPSFCPNPSWCSGDRNDQGKNTWLCPFLIDEASASQHTHTVQSMDCLFLGCPISPGKDVFMPVNFTRG